MTKIDPKLFKRLCSALDLSTPRVYQLIQAKANETFLPRNLAAIALAAQYGMNVAQYANSEELASIRQATVGAAKNVQTTLVPQLPERQQSSTKTRVARRNGKARERSRMRRGTSVFVVHGRDTGKRKELCRFLRAIGLNPLEWHKAIKATNKPSPFVGEILDAAFREAVAIVVLLTPDDEARLKKEFQKPSDGTIEKDLAGQARPNVLFEAGMAFGRSPEATVLVQVGQIKPFSDIAGRHVVYLTDAAESRQELVTKLANAGCNVDTSGTDWLSEGNFA